MKYYANVNIIFDGEDYAPGELVPLTVKQAAALGDAITTTPAAEASAVDEAAEAEATEAEATEAEAPVAPKKSRSKKSK